MLRGAVRVPRRREVFALGIDGRMVTLGHQCTCGCASQNLRVSIAVSRKQLGHLIGRRAAHWALGVGTVGHRLSRVNISAIRSLVRRKGHRWCAHLLLIDAAVKTEEAYSARSYEPWASGIEVSPLYTDHSRCGGGPQLRSAFPNDRSSFSRTLIRLGEILPFSMVMSAPMLELSSGLICQLSGFLSFVNSRSGTIRIMVA
jgi:hypothetical protein